MYRYKYGEVTTWQEQDLAYVKACMQLDVPQLSSVGIFPSIEQLEEFSSLLLRTGVTIESAKLSGLLNRFIQASRLDQRYFLCDHEETCTIANWLDPIPLSLKDR